MKLGFINLITGLTFRKHGQCIKAVPGVAESVCETEFHERMSRVAGPNVFVMVISNFNLPIPWFKSMISATQAVEKS